MRESPAAAAAAGDEVKVMSDDVRDEDESNGKVESAAGKSDPKSDQEFIFIHDTGFTVKIAPPGVDAFDIQVIILISIMNTGSCPIC